LVLGVVFGFLGEAMDNIYWALPWSAYYLGLPIAEDLTQLGAYMNIFFRQTCGMLAATCHIISFCVLKKNIPHGVNAVMYLAPIGGVIFIMLLIYAEYLFV
jgi:hypothetical protein